MSVFSLTPFLDCHAHCLLMMFLEKARRIFFIRVGKEVGNFGFSCYYRGCHGRWIKWPWVSWTLLKDSRRTCVNKLSGCHLFNLSVMLLNFEFDFINPLYHVQAIREHWKTCEARAIQLKELGPLFRDYQRLITRKLLYVFYLSRCYLREGIVILLINFEV